MVRFSRIKLLVLALVMLPLVNVYSQKYSFDWREVPIQKCLQDIEQASGHDFYYADAWLQGLTVTRKIEAGGLEMLLTQLMVDSELNFSIIDKNVIITKKPVIQSLSIASGIAQKQAIQTNQFNREFAGIEDLIAIGQKSLDNGRYIINGIIVGIQDSLPIPGVIVYNENLQINAVSDASGRYSIELPKEGKYMIKTQSVGMQPESYDVMVLSKGTLDIYLRSEAVLLEEVSVVADADRNVASTELGLTKISMQEAKNIPKVLGENDIVQVALALPGVQSVGEGASGLNVRGGKTDQNLVLFNNITLYNPYHFFGFFSAFNANIIGETELYKGSVPARFGGRLSSILDVKIKEGDAENLSGKAGISPVTSKLNVNVPLVKGKTSLTMGGRATYSNWITRSIDNETIKNSDPAFYDLALEVSHRMKDNGSLKVTGYYSFDRFKLTPDSSFSYRNIGASVLWKKPLKNNFILHSSAAFSQYSFTIKNQPSQPESFEYGFDIRDLNLKSYVDYSWGGRHNLVGGIDLKYYELKPGRLVPLGEASQVTTRSLDTENGIESAIFLSDNFSIGTKLRMSAGIRYSSFTPLGARTINFYEDGVVKNNASLLETRSYGNGEAIDTYSGPEGRISLTYLLTNNFSLKANYTSMRQYMHALSNTVSVSPLDTWKLTDPNVKPQTSTQYSFGLFRNSQDNSIESSIEVYYKDYTNIIDYKVGANLTLNELLEQDVLQGVGRSRGIEFLLRKKTGKLTGWIGYTYSRSEQKFQSEFAEETINLGEYFPSNFDKPHDFSLVANYKLSRRLSVSMNFIYTSGRPVTYPTAKYTLSNREIIHFGNRNEFRVRDYMRMDLGINVEPSHKKDNKLYTYWSISVYNLTSRDNVYSVFFRSEEDGNIQGYRLSVLASAIPSLTYNVIF